MTKKPEGLPTRAYTVFSKYFPDRKVSKARVMSFLKKYDALSLHGLKDLKEIHLKDVKGIYFLNYGISTHAGVLKWLGLPVDENVLEESDLKPLRHLVSKYGKDKIMSAVMKMQTLPEKSIT